MTDTNAPSVWTTPESFISERVHYRGCNVRVGDNDATLVIVTTVRQSLTRLTVFGGGSMLHCIDTTDDVAAAWAYAESWLRAQAAEAVDPAPTIDCDFCGADQRVVGQCCCQAQVDLNGALQVLDAFEKAAVDPTPIIDPSTVWREKPGCSYRDRHRHATVFAVRDGVHNDSIEGTVCVTATGFRWALNTRRHRFASGVAATEEAAWDVATAALIARCAVRDGVVVVVLDETPEDSVRRVIRAAPRALRPSEVLEQSGVTSTVLADMINVGEMRISDTWGVSLEARGHGPAVSKPERDAVPPPRWVVAAQRCGYRLVPRARVAAALLTDDLDAEYRGWVWATPHGEDTFRKSVDHRNNMHAINIPKLLKAELPEYGVRFGWFDLP